MTPERVRELFDYDKETGFLLWRKPKARRIKIGSRAGVLQKGKCIDIMIDYCNYKAHHLVWLHQHGEWPLPEIDHIDGNPLNNRLDNLRIATRQQNTINVAMHKDNFLGAKGVTISRSKFLARIGSRRIGLFNTIEEASEAYEKAAKETHGEFFRSVR